MTRIERDRKQRSPLPLEDLRFALTFLPHLGAATALHHKHLLFVQMLLDVESAGSRNLHDIEPPKALGAVKLNIAAASSQALPGTHRQVLHAPDTDAPVDRHIFPFHEPV